MMGGEHEIAAVLQEHDGIIGATDLAGALYDRLQRGAMRRLVLAGLRPFTEPALRVFATLVLPPVLDGRAISAPKGRKSLSYRAEPSFWKRRTSWNRACAI